MMMNDRFPMYDVDYISGVMSLRSPQKKSLEILADIVGKIGIKKERNLTEDLATVTASYPICTGFDRDFASLAFALATGVGKTRLMGAFIAYLYTNWGIKNFLVVAPGKTIYDKLQKDLGVPGSRKYVFDGVGCFLDSPNLITGDNYSNRAGSLFSEINITVFNIDKFNKDSSEMKKLDEYIGKSYFEYMASLPDLVVLMDESHHYRAKAGWAAINELKPVLGLELTATPKFTKDGKEIAFKNVVYDYPLAKAIADGYTRTPYALTRTDIDVRNFGDEELDKMMLTDGIACHEETRAYLQVYATNNGKKTVKPFVLVVCKDTAHAEQVKAMICCDDFKEGYYKDKTIVVHSNQRGEESEENLALLLDVEKPENPVEIVIHVNKLKEGWDVNNLYTIIPLRTATSAILREQMVGRGLRLPYGQRTGDEVVDRVVITAHDKFAELIKQAQRGDSIFKAQHIIKVTEPLKTAVVQPELALNTEGEEDDLQKCHLPSSEENRKIVKKIKKEIVRRTEKKFSEAKGNTAGVDDQEIAKQVTEQVRQDYGDKLRDNYDYTDKWIKEIAKATKAKVQEKYIPIPLIKIADNSETDYEYLDFDLDFTSFNHFPVKDKLLIQNLLNASDREVLAGEHYSFDNVNPMKQILGILRDRDEIDYDAVSGLLFKLIKGVCDYYENKYGSDGLKNIALLYKKEIADLIFGQMEQHKRQSGELFDSYEIGQLRPYNLKPMYIDNGYSNDLHADFDRSKVKSIIFTGIKKGVFSEAKFDSGAEVDLARILESDAKVLNWLRPSAKEFNLKYDNGRHNYEPDFVIETADVIYLTEVKAKSDENDADVLMKKRAGERYCEKATKWGEENGYKEWKYLFIPDSDIRPNSTFQNLILRHSGDDSGNMKVSEPDDVRVREGNEVFSKNFGHGVVIKVIDGMIKVDFNGFLKAYIMPDCFENRELERLNGKK